MCSDNRYDLEAQVTIIGGGGAGLAAAVTAAEKGMDVLLIEKYHRPGGNSAMAKDIFGAESPTQKRMGISVLRDEYFKIAMEFAHWTINPRIMRAFIDKSGDTIAWLEGKGITFAIREREFVRFNHRLPVSRHTPTGDGIEIIQVLAKNFQELGGRLLCDTAAKELITNAKNRVVGVFATTKDGQELRIRADSVIMATGGYGGNKEMLKKYCPQYRKNMMLCGFPNMGEGISMALKIGAASEGLGMLQLEYKGLPKGHKRLMRITPEPYMLCLNKRGERFMDESVDNVFEGANAVLRQPDAISYTIFDDGVKRRIMETGLIRDLGFRPPWPKKEEKLPDLPNLLQTAVNKGCAKLADSWDEMAVWMGAEPETLKATIKEYNSFCNKGHDVLFSKDPKYLMPLRNPPYNAIRCVIRFLGTMGGIKINHHMEVLDRNDNPIPGLYAGGIDTGGWESETYNQLLMGTTLSFAYNSGRIAGENATEYVLSK